MRNSDSGVVMRMSGGVVAIARRSLAGVSPERTPTVMSRLRESQPGRGVPDAGERGPQVALDVDRQRLERRDVEHPAARASCPPAARGRQPVQRPQERAQRLAGPGRRDDEGVATGGDRRPGADLGRRSARRRQPRTRSGWPRRTRPTPRSPPGRSPGHPVARHRQSQGAANRGSPPTNPMGSVGGADYVPRRAPEPVDATRSDAAHPGAAGPQAPAPGGDAMISARGLRKSFGDLRGGQGHRRRGAPRRGVRLPRARTVPASPRRCG